jgi:FkbM family methyltransferase
MSEAVGPCGRVIAFEPQKKIFRELFMNLDLNKCSNVVPLRCALGDANKEVYMAAPLPGNEGGRYIGEGTEVVSMRRLDEFCLTNVSFIKMDVENFEDNVLDGAVKTIQNNRPVMLIEIQGNHEQAAATGADRWQRTQVTIKKLIDLGYKVSCLCETEYLAIPAA